MTTKVLVLGTGHIGRAIAHLLSSAQGEPGFRVTVADRQVAPDVRGQFEGWADQAFACGPMPMLRALSRLAEGRRGRLGVAALGRKRGSGRPDPLGSTAARRKAFLQVSMEQNMGCAVGACLGCVVMSVTGTPQRVCREGPVFASEELAWEGAWS